LDIPLTVSGESQSTHTPTLQEWKQRKKSKKKGNMRHYKGFKHFFKAKIDECG